MDDFRSKSMHQIETYNNNNNNNNNNNKGHQQPSMQDLSRCYSASYASSVVPHHHHQIGPNPNTNTNSNGNNNELKFKKGKSTNASVSNSWSFNDPELQRKRRVASYKVYSVEGKVKGSFKKSFRWIKDRCSRMVYGW
ncbi:hypothetical protein ACFE04_014071 [Oxalis oulophora]